MSASTKRKHVTAEVAEAGFNFSSDCSSIVRIVAGKGNNLHEVEDGRGERYLVSMPSKFRKNVWVKRGDFVVVEPIAEGQKVKAEIVTVLLKEQIRHLRNEGHWPEAFSVTDEKSKDASDSKSDDKANECEELSESDEDESDDDSDLFKNTNRQTLECSSSDSSSSDED